MGPNRISCESVRLFVRGNNTAKYCKVLLNYCYHPVSRSAMTGVATMPAHQRNSLGDKVPRMRGSSNTSAKPAREAGDEGRGNEEGRKEGRGRPRRGRGRIDERRQKREAIERSTER